MATKKTSRVTKSIAARPGLPDYIAMAATMEWRQLIATQPNYRALWEKTWAPESPCANIADARWLEVTQNVGVAFRSMDDGCHAVNWDKVSDRDVVNLFAWGFATRIAALRMVPADQGDVYKRTIVFLTTILRSQTYAEDAQIVQNGQVVIPKGQACQSTISHLFGLVFGPPAGDVLVRRGKRVNDGAGFAAALFQFCTELRRGGFLAGDDEAETATVDRLDRGARGALPKSTPRGRLSELKGQIPLTIGKEWGAFDPLNSLIEALEGGPIKYAPKKIAEDVLDHIKKVRRWERDVSSDTDESITMRIIDEGSARMRPPSSLDENEEGRFNEQRELLQRYARLGPTERARVDLLLDPRTVPQQALAAGRTDRAIQYQRAEATKAFRAWVTVRNHQ